MSNANLRDDATVVQYLPRLKDDTAAIQQSFARLKDATAAVQRHLALLENSFATIQQRLARLEAAITIAPILRLNDDALLLIFKQIPLKDLLCSVQYVCRKWCELVPILTHKEQKLKIMIRFNPDDNTRFIFSTIGGESFLSRCRSKIVLEQLCYYFPRITQLKVNFDCSIDAMFLDSAVLATIELLQKCSMTLVSLVIDVCLSSHWRELVVAINNLSGIRNLKIEIDKQFDGSLDLSVLSYLDRFTFSYDGVSQLVDSFRRYANVNQHPQFIETDYPIGCSELRHLLQLPSNVAEKFIQLKICFIKSKIDLPPTLRPVVGLFNGIKYFTINRVALDALCFQEEDVFFECWRTLASLPQLESLGISTNRKWNPILGDRIMSLPPFKTLKRLDLKSPPRADHTFSFPPHSSSLADIFPKLEDIYFYYNTTCSICDLKKLNKLDYSPNFCDTSVKIMKKSLRRCALRLAEPWLTSCPLLRELSIYLMSYELEYIEFDTFNYDFSQSDLLELNINDENEEKDYDDEDYYHYYDYDDEEDDYDDYDDYDDEEDDSVEEDDYDPYDKEYDIYIT